MAKGHNHYCGLIIQFYKSPNIITSRVKRSSDIYGLLLTTFELSSRRYHQAYETVEVRPHPELSAQKFETQCVENQLIRTHAQTEERMEIVIIWTLNKKKKKTVKMYIRYIIVITMIPKSAIMHPFATLFYFSHLR